MERLVHVERYIKSMQIRVQRAVVDFEKDQAKLKEVKTFSASLDKLVKALSPNASDEKRQAIEEFFWMIEEYKVSVFAQELKTAVPVSRKRLENKLAEISRMV
jgi:ATP-dependent helicase HrpA